MKTSIKKILALGLSLTIFISVIAATKQVIGPSTATTANAIVRWSDTSGWKTTNSVVTIDDSGNVSGINTQSVEQVRAATAYLTNGLVNLQKSSAPVAGDIGGTVGSVTNYMIVNKDGTLIAYWSDGTTLYSKTLSP